MPPPAHQPTANVVGSWPAYRAPRCASCCTGVGDRAARAGAAMGVGTPGRLGGPTRKVAQGIAGSGAGYSHRSTSAAPRLAAPARRPLGPDLRRCGHFRRTRGRQNWPARSVSHKPVRPTRSSSALRFSMARSGTAAAGHITRKAAHADSGAGPFSRGICDLAAIGTAHDCRELTKAYPDADKEAKEPPGPLQAPAFLPPRLPGQAAQAPS